MGFLLLFWQTAQVMLSAVAVCTKMSNGGREIDTCQNSFRDSDHGMRGLCSASIFCQDDVMAGYTEIDPILMKWAEARGLHVYTGHRQNVVRSVTVYVWIGPRHDSTGHIWIDPISDMGLVGVHAAVGAFRIDEAVPLSGLAAALDADTDRLAEQKRRIDAHA
jgi:hypothetical protein